MQLYRSLILAAAIATIAFATTSTEEGERVEIAEYDHEVSHEPHIDFHEETNSGQEDEMEESINEDWFKDLMDWEHEAWGKELL